MVQDFSHQRVLEIPHISWALIFVICHSASYVQVFFCALMAGAIRREMHLVYMYDFSDWNSSSKISRNMPKLFTHHFKFQTEFRIHFFHFLNPELSLKTSFVCFAFPQSSDQKGMDSRNRFPTSKWKYRLTLGRQNIPFTSWVFKGYDNTTSLRTLYNSFFGTTSAYPKTCTPAVL